VHGVNFQQFWNSKAGGQTYCILRWPAHGICVLCPPICCRYRHTTDSLLTSRWKVWMVKKGWPTEQTALWSDPAARHPDNGTHSHTNCSMNYSDCSCHLVVLSQLRFSFCFHANERQTDKHNVMVTRYEDKHCLLLDTLCGQNVTAGGTQVTAVFWRLKLLRPEHKAYFLRERLTDCLLHTSCSDTCLETEGQPDRSFALPRRNCVLVQAFM